MAGKIFWNLLILGHQYYVICKCSISQYFFQVGTTFIFWIFWVGRGRGRGRHFYINFLLFYYSNICNNRVSAIYNSFKILFWKFKKNCKVDPNKTLKIGRPQFEKFWISANNMIWLNISCSDKPAGNPWMKILWIIILFSFLPPKSTKREILIQEE